jgi:hypothetical protein
MVDRFPGEKSESMTSVGVLARRLDGEDARSELVKRGFGLLEALPPVWNANDGSIDLYYWYYGFLASAHMPGDPWRAHRGVIVQSQRRDGGVCGYEGSWDPADAWGPDGGRVYSTALMTLALESPYRFPRGSRGFPGLPGGDADSSYPPVAPSRLAVIREHLARLDVPGALARAQEAYDQALDAKKQGDDAAWKAGLDAAAGRLRPVLEGWDAIVASLPISPDHDPDAVAAHHLRAEAVQVQKALELLSRIEKQRR